MITEDTYRKQHVGNDFVTALDTDRDRACMVEKVLGKLRTVGERAEPINSESSAYLQHSDRP